MNLVCVGIPFYNAEKYLDYAIRSVLNQTYTDWKMILIDDGSTDLSLLLARKYINDSRINVISDGQNRGLVYRLNELIKLSNCKYFVRMDADDIMHPQRLEKQFQYLEEHPEIDVIGSWAYSIDTENRVVGLLENKIEPMYVEDIFMHTCFIHPSIMGKKSWFEMNSYDPKFVRVEDMELWCRTIENSVFYNLSEPLLYYREVGLPYLSKYLLSMRGERCLIKQIYGKSIFVRYKMLIKNYGKCLVFTMLSFFKMQNVLIQKRSSKIEFNLLQEASQDLLKAIKKSRNEYSSCS